VRSIDKDKEIKKDKRRLRGNRHCCLEVIYHHWFTGCCGYNRIKGYLKNSGNDGGNKNSGGLKSRGKLLVVG